MKAQCWGTLGLCLLSLAPADPIPQLRSRVLDLRQWGYEADPLIASHGEFYPPPHMLSIYGDGSIVAGFVRPSDNLATRGRPSLILRVAVFDRQGKFLGQSGFPTTMWKDNGIWAIDSAGLIVRTPEALGVRSREGELLAERSPIDPQTYIRVSPDRHRLLLLLPHDEPELVLTHSLKALGGCSYHSSGVVSIADHAVLRLLRREPALSVRVEEVCGLSRFDYAWADGGLREVVLLDDARLLVRSQHGIEVVHRDKRVWSDSFKKGELIQEMEADENGDTIAVAVARYVGGNEFLDINGHLKEMRIILYRAVDGKRIAELVVAHPPRLAFNFFALSPDGLVVSVLSDGFLQIADVHQ